MTAMRSKTIGTQQNIKYQERLAVRAIVKNDKNEIIIIHAKKENYYKLPGGGIEGNEDHATAVQREILEETGCVVRMEGECIGVVEEWRIGLHQFSHCYVATLVEDTGKTALTEEEMGDGLVHEWVDFGRVLEVMKGVEPGSELGRFIQERDIFFVEVFAGLGRLAA